MFPLPRVERQRGSQANGNTAGGNGGRQPLPPGVSDVEADQGLATAAGRGGFQQTDLTGEGTAQPGETTTPQNNNNAGPQLSAALTTGGASSSGDSFLLQGTIGQGFGLRMGPLGSQA